MNKSLKKTKLASLLLVSSLATTTFAGDSQGHLIEADNESTYWGLGIGSVLGGVIAGPPGIALGAAIGGSFGWGQDQSDALEQSREIIHEKQDLEKKNAAALNRSNQKLKAANARIGELKRSKEDQAQDLQDLRLALEEKEQALSQSDLAQVLNNYTQEIYFEKAQSQVPDYAQDRVAKLALFLKSYPQLQVNLTGYTDQSGSAEFNQRLSQSRAESIRNVLLSEGIEASRIVLEAQGETMANVDVSDQGNTILDRRVAIEFSLSVNPIEGGSSEELVSKLALEEIVESVVEGINTGEQTLDVTNLAKSEVTQ